MTDGSGEIGLLTNADRSASEAALDLVQLFSSNPEGTLSGYELAKLDARKLTDVASVRAVLERAGTRIRFRPSGRTEIDGVVLPASVEQESKLPGKGPFMKKRWELLSFSPRCEPPRPLRRPPAQENLRVLSLIDELVTHRQRPRDGIDDGDVSSTAFPGEPLRWLLGISVLAFGAWFCRRRQPASPASDG